MFIGLQKVVWAVILAPINKQTTIKGKKYFFIMMIKKAIYYVYTVATETSFITSEVSDVVSEIPFVVSEVSDVATEIPFVASEVSDVVSETPFVTSEIPFAVSEVSEMGLLPSYLYKPTDLLLTTFNSLLSTHLATSVLNGLAGKPSSLYRLT